VKSRTINFPIALGSGLVALILCSTSIFFPWWRLHDNRFGTTWSFLIIVIRKIKPNSSLDYIWSITHLRLRNTLLGALILVAGGLIFNWISFKFRGLDFRVILLRRRIQCNIPGLFYTLGGFSSLAAYLIFRIDIHSYLKSIGQSFSGTSRYSLWGMGLGANLILAGGLFELIGGILYLIKSDTVSIEMIIERARERSIEIIIETEE